MNTEFVKEWTGELRSGRFRQGFGRLGTIENPGEKPRFCCLGVAEELLVEKGLQTRTVVDDDDIGSYICYGDNESGTLESIATKYLDTNMWNPEINLRRALGLSDPEHLGMEFTLAELNDEGFTFDQIADLIDYFFGGNK